MRRHIVALIVVCICFFLTSNNAFPSTITHKVKRGENLSSIAKKYHVPVDTLKELNNLKSAKLKLGQQIIVKQDVAAVPGKSGKKKQEVKNTRSEANDASVAESDDEFIEYKTKKGDTFAKIAIKFNIEKEDILEANSLTTDKKLSPGKIIRIPKIIEEKDEEFITLTNKPLKPWKDSEEKYMLVKVAKSFMGAPYKYGGNSVRGLDCSAFVKKIYDIFEVQLPRSARDQFRVGLNIDKEDLAIGDLVFFRTKRYIKYPTHVGIYIGDGNFIHSSSRHNRLGVKIDSLSSDFYINTFIGAKRVKQPSDESAETTKSIEKASNNS